jgi:hypothetical protein
MFDRWRKLLKAVYNTKKEQYDISKIPDIYDSVKYDVIHNSELGLDLQELYEVCLSFEKWQSLHCDILRMTYFPILFSGMT